VFGEAVAPGLARWVAPHPEWRPDSGGAGGWERDVACLWLEHGDGVTLIDPLSPEGAEGERFWAALEDRDVTVLLTVVFHLRSAPELRERGAAVLALPGALGDLDLATASFADGDTLPGGVVAVAPVPSAGEQEAAFWLPEQRALAVGDVLVGTPDGLRVWFQPEFGDTVADLRERVLPFVDRLSELPVERVLVPHGVPVTEGGQAALRAARDAPVWQH